MSTRQTNIRIPAELVAAAQREAKKQDRSLSQIVRDLLRRWVKRQEQKPTK